MQNYMECLNGLKLSYFFFLHAQNFQSEILMAVYWHTGAIVKHI